MSVEDDTLKRDFEQQLRQTLAKARDVKQTTSIEPALPIAPFESDIKALLNLSSNASDTDRDAKSSLTYKHSAFETAARDIFYDHVSACAADPSTFIDICNLLDLLQQCSDATLCDGSLTLWLVEELLDSQTIDGCRRVFDYLESRRERMIGSDSQFSQNKRMIVLRSCNELLRRLSRAEDAVFCGRVFMFLFQSFPLGDKSSVNLRGEFHTENVTIFDEIGERREGDDETRDQMEVDEVVKEEDRKEEMKVEAAQPATGNQASTNTTTTVTTAKTPGEVDAENEDEEEMDMDTLYTTFWSLQRIFSNPTRIFADDELEAFKKGLEVTLKKFKSVPKILQTRGTPRAPHEQRRKLKRKRTSDQDEFASNFNPKYLTSRDLFELEMSDLTFQRHILIQSLIFLDFLLSLTPKAKDRLSKLNKAQKALIFPYTLTPANTTWAQKTRADISSYLQTDQDGKYYHRMIDNVLSRDKNWVRWKIESCPSISLAPLATSLYLEAKAGAKKHCTPRRIKANPMGAMNLDFLVDGAGADGAAVLEKLREKERYTPPDAQTYVKDAEGLQLDLEMAVGKEEKASLVEQRASKTWRVLRMAAKNRFSVFDDIDETKNLDALDDEKVAARLAEEEAKAAEEEANGKTGMNAEEVGAIQKAEDKLPEAREAAQDITNEDTAMVDSTDAAEAEAKLETHPSAAPVDDDAADKSAAAALQLAAGELEGSAVQEAAEEAGPLADVAQLDESEVLPPTDREEVLEGARDRHGEREEEEGGVSLALHAHGGSGGGVDVDMS